MSIWKKAILSVVAVFLVLYSFSVNANAEEQGKVIIEAVGFFTHFPMRPTRGVIEDTCAKFGERVELTLYDEMKPEGQEFMALKGLSGHIPMRLFINGLNTVTIDGRAISFRDFVNRAWNADDLEKAIMLALEGKIGSNSAEEP
jgi:hypothetical protein